MTTTETALIMRDAGGACIPVDKEKRPLIDRWKQAQDSLPDESTLRDYFRNGAGIALVAGPIQCIDIDRASLIDKYKQAAIHHGLDDVWGRLVIHKTPSGGFHLIFQTACEPVRNMKLAQEGEVGGYQTLIETRGKGGYFLIPPSPGYVAVQNSIITDGLTTIPILTEEERDSLIEVARTFDRREPKEGGPRESGDQGGDTPGDDYDARGDLPGLLRSHGWTPVGKTHWRRPDKARGVSASLGHVPGRFFVFSTSTQFESEHVYRPWHVYAILEHAGDYTAAARALRIAGFGGKQEGPKSGATSVEADNVGVEKAKEPERESRFFPASDFYGIDVPERKWLVRGLIPMNTVTLLSGDGGTGKSLVSLQLAVDGATNGKWMGKEVLQGPTLFITAEDDKEELHRRVCDIARHAEMSIATASALTLRSLAGEDALLATMEGRTGKIEPTGLYWEIDEWMKRNRPTLTVLDTLADFFPGNENDRAQVRHFVGLLRGLAIRNECSVILLAHPSVDGMRSGTGTSGSTAWNNSVRSRLYLRRVEKDGYEENTDRRVLTTKKANYGKLGGEISMLYQQGVFVPEKEPTNFERMARENERKKVFMEIMKDFETKGVKVFSWKGNKASWAKMFPKHDLGNGYDENMLEEVLVSLIADGAIEAVEDPDTRIAKSKRKEIIRIKNGDLV